MKIKFIALTALVVLSFSAAYSQKPIGRLERQRGQDMLRMAKKEVLDRYYDPTYRGIDMEAKFKAAHDKIETAVSNGQIMGIIAQVLVDMEDSHTRFIPPARADRTEYGWEMQMIGDRAFVTAVKPKSDAEAKGLKVGDEIWSVDGFAPLRETMWKMKYLYYSLQPQSGMRLVIRNPDGTDKQIDVLAKVSRGRRVVDLTGNDIWDLIRAGENEDYLRRHRFVTIGDEVFVWKMPAFDLEENKIDEMMGKVRKQKSLVLDLRGNGGGMVKTMNRLIGHLFDRDVPIAEWKGRKKYDPQIAKSRGSKPFAGKVIVLIDSESGSAAEIFARVMQLEKRGTVIGDRSSGKVMVSRYYGHKSGVDVVAYYGVSVTEADPIMTDGKSLENTGVTPDMVMIPSAKDLAASSDPVLAHAIILAGGMTSPADAGKFFPIEWPEQ